MKSLNSKNYSKKKTRNSKLGYKINWKMKKEKIKFSKK